MVDSKKGEPVTVAEVINLVIQLGLLVVAYLAHRKNRKK
jgi:hypothetical protein